MHGGKAAVPDKRQRLGELLLRLLREAADQVGGDGGTVKVGVQQRHRLAEPCRVIFPVHPLQRIVTAGLKGQVEVGTQVGQRGGAAAEILRDGAGL